MREIKFRAKHASGTWNIQGLNVLGELVVNFNKHKHLMNTIGQFTGLYDKNGKEIYEGDIIHVLLEDNKPKRDFIAFVLWNESYGGFQLSQYDYFMNSNCYGFEIIGNIHDNPELVKND